MKVGTDPWRLCTSVLAVTAAVLLVGAVATQARRRECVVPERLDEVAKVAWSLPRVSPSAHSSAGWCFNVEEDKFGPLTVREECADCSGPPDSWCEKSVLTVRIRPYEVCANDTPWSAPAAKGSAYDLSERVEVRSDVSRGAFVVLASRDYFDDDAWAPYRVELPENPLHEPVHAVTFRAETRRGFQVGHDAFALLAAALAIALSLLVTRAPRALPLVAAAAGMLAVALSLHALLMSM